MLKIHHRTHSYALTVQPRSLGAPTCRFAVALPPPELSCTFRPLVTAASPCMQGARLLAHIRTLPHAALRVSASAGVDVRLEPRAPTVRSGCVCTGRSPLRCASARRGGGRLGRVCLAGVCAPRPPVREPRPSRVNAIALPVLPPSLPPSLPARYVTEARRSAAPAPSPPRRLDP